MHDLAALKALALAMMVGGVLFVFLSLGGELLGVEADQAVAGIALLAGGIGFDRARRALERVARECAELRARPH